MLSKFCSRCGRKIPIGSGSCKCAAGKQRAPARQGKYTDVDKAFYHTAEWELARDECIRRCFGLDLYSLFVLHRIEYGFTVHHIVPLIDNHSLRKTQSNLIYLTESNHRNIHKLYESDYEGTAELLRSLLRRFSDTQGGT